MDLSVCKRRKTRKIVCFCAFLFVFLTLLCGCSARVDVTNSQDISKIQYNKNGVVFSLPDTYSESAKDRDDGTVMFYYYSEKRDKQFIFSYNDVLKNMSANGKSIEDVSIYEILNDVISQNSKMPFNDKYEQSEVLISGVPAIRFSYEQYDGEERNSSNYELSVDAVVFPVNEEGIAQLAFSYNKNSLTGENDFDLDDVLSEVIIPQGDYNMTTKSQDEINIETLRDELKEVVAPRSQMLDIVMKYGFAEEKANEYLATLNYDYTEFAKLEAKQLAQENIYTQNQMKTRLLEIGYTEKEADAGSSGDNIDYNDMALDAALMMFDLTEMSDDEIYESLIENGFSEKEAKSAIDGLENAKNSIDDGERTVRGWYY